MLMRFGVATSSVKPNCINFHEITKLYACKRGVTRVAQAMVQAVYLRGSISQYSEFLWVACFLLFGFGNDPVVVELDPSGLLTFAKHVVLRLAIHSFVTFSHCNAALELLRLCADTLELTAEYMVSRAEKWLDRSLCCLKLAQTASQCTYLWEELTLLTATVLETTVNLMLKGRQFDIGDDLIRPFSYRTSICGEHHPDAISAGENLESSPGFLQTFIVEFMLMYSILSLQIIILFFYAISE